MSVVVTKCVPPGVKVMSNVPRVLQKSYTAVLKFNNPALAVRGPIIQDAPSLSAFLFLGRKNMSTAVLIDGVIFRQTI